MLVSTAGLWGTLTHMYDELLGPFSWENQFLVFVFVVVVVVLVYGLGIPKLAQVQRLGKRS